jgi:predicted TIM-barrel fold metal-dependent hydrolase
VQRAAEFGLPIQFHTGYLAGNRGLLGQGDPRPLIPVLRRYAGVRFDLFHAGWPYSELMGAIGKAFPNAWLDLCWAWTMNPAQMERILSEWLAAVPHNKIFGYGGDTGSPFPMVGYALQARRGIANVLEAKVESGEYDEETARQVAQRVMHANAREFYGME